MKRVFIISGLFITFTFSVFAHPLGNFSINQFSKIEPTAVKIRIRQVLDIAEIPTFQLTTDIDSNDDGKLDQTELNSWLGRMTPQYVSNLDLSISGEGRQLTVESSEVSALPGAGGLSIIRIGWDLSADVAEPGRVVFHNNNYAERLGWNEIFVSRDSSINVFDSTAFGNAVTDELKAYPQNSIIAPLAERTAEFSYVVGNAPEGSKLLTARNGAEVVLVQKDMLAELISVKEITPLVIMIGLFIAFGLGALHALSPGHGKTIVGAYLVGSKGTPKHALFLGLVVTITHTLGVFALGLITLFASNYILPDRLMPFLSFVSGLLVFFIGISLFKERLFSALGWKAASHGHSHSHDNGENHSHDRLTHSHGGSTHTHMPPKDISLKSLLGLGISGGLLPCPSALVLMLSAISLGRVGYGLVLTLVFSLGLAATLTTVGLVFLFVGKAFGNSSLSQNRIFKAMPAISSLVIACVGAVICYKSIG